MAVFHSRMTLNGFPWIHGSTWLWVSQETMREGQGDTERFNLWSQRKLILATKSTTSIDLHTLVKATVF